MFVDNASSNLAISCDVINSDTSYDVIKYGTELNGEYERQQCL